MMTTAETAALTDRLAAAHGFDHEDLAANRLGEVTVAQARRMRTILKRRVRTAWRLVPVLIVCAVLVVILYPTKIIWAVLFAFVAMVSAGIAVIGTPRLSELQRERVDAFHGAVKPTTVSMEQDTPNRHYYTVDGHKVRIEILHGHDPIDVGQWYRVYVMSKHKRLLSIEAVDGPAEGTTGARMLTALTGHWRLESPIAGLPSIIEIRPDGTVIADAGGLLGSGRLVVVDDQHVRIIAGPDNHGAEWHVALQGDRLQIKLTAHRHIDFVRVP